MIHTVSLTTHQATHHSDEGGVSGFIRSSLNKLWNAVLYGAGHHIGYELAWVIAGVAVVAGLGLLLKKRRNNQSRNTGTHPEGQDRPLNSRDRMR